MNYNHDLNDKYFEAIKVGTKKIEGRAPKDADDKRYEQMKVGDTVTFTNNVTNEQIICEILSVNHYKDARSMLEAKGIENVLPGELDIEYGIKIYDNLEGYEERIKKFGIYAIGVKVK